jgi:hypothetical protein
MDASTSLVDSVYHRKENSPRARLEPADVINII